MKIDTTGEVFLLVFAIIVVGSPIGYFVAKGVEAHDEKKGPVLLQLVGCLFYLVFSISFVPFLIWLFRGY